MRCSVNRLLQLATKPRLQSTRSDTSSHVWPSANSKISRARRASSARSVRLLARRVNSISSEFVNVIASLMDAIIVYKWLLQSTSARFVARDSSTTTKSFVFFIQISSPRRYIFGLFQPPTFQKKPRTARPCRNYPPNATSTLSLDSLTAAIPDRVCDAMTSDTGKWNERMNLGTLHAHNVVNLNPAYSQRIGDERTVATPWNRFRAHNRTPLLPGQFDQSV